MVEHLDRNIKASIKLEIYQQEPLPLTIKEQLGFTMEGSRWIKSSIVTEHGSNIIDIDIVLMMQIKHKIIIVA